MPEDLKLITKRDLSIPPDPVTQNIESEFFGDRSNDLQLSTRNDFDTVTGITKLRQDINKILLTVRGTNTNFTLYGTALQDLVGNKVNFQVIQAKVRDEVIGALQVLQFVNKENPNPDERPDILEILEVNLLSSNEVQVQLSVITVSGKRISSNIVISA